MAKDRRFYAVGVVIDSMDAAYPVAANTLRRLPQTDNNLLFPLSIGAFSRTFQDDIFVVNCARRPGRLIFVPVLSQRFDPALTLFRSTPDLFAHTTSLLPVPLLSSRSIPHVTLASL